MFPRSRGKREDLVPGVTKIAYSVSSEEKAMSVGLFMRSLEETQEVEVHVYGVAKDLRLTTKWRPLYYNRDGYPSHLEEGDCTEQAVLEKIAYN